MAFPAASIVPAKGYIRAKEIAYHLDLKCAEAIAKLSEPIAADIVWSWYQELYTKNQVLQEIAAIPGIVAYAEAQEDDPTLDIAAEFQTMMSAITAAGEWMYSAFPRDADGYVLIYKTTPDGQLVPRTFSTTATAPLIPLLQAVADSIA
jgi:hypothetical protein